jgi:phosphate transport system substrate-binding protein
MNRILHWNLFLLSCLFVSCGPKVETVVIKGSDTEVNLVVKLAETFMDDDPDVSIAVTGGGSGTGIAALINKKTDIANSSRAFKEAELVLARERDVDVLPVVFALDALSFIVHENSPVDSLSLDQICDLFTGQTENWSSLGGGDIPVSLYGRQGNSGTFSFIQQSILKADYSLDMKQMNGTSQIIESIKNDVAGIGYVGIGYIIQEDGGTMEGVKVLKILGDGDSVAVDPVITDNITSGAYPIVRPLYQYLDGKPSGKLKEFLDFELSSEGQEIIFQNGYFPINKAYHRQNESILNP